jgi:hypothetical protein
MKDQQHIIASHEIGHVLIAYYFGFKTIKIDAINSYSKILFGDFKIVANQLSKLETPNNINLEFVFKFLQIILAGDICEELFQKDFKTKQVSLSVNSLDTDIYTHCFKILGMENKDQQGIISLVAGLCISQKSVLPPLLNLLKSNQWVLLEDNIPSFLSNEQYSSKQDCHLQ